MGKSERGKKLMESRIDGIRCRERQLRGRGYESQERDQQFLDLLDGKGSGGLMRQLKVWCIAVDEHARTPLDLGA